MSAENLGAHAADRHRLIALLRTLSYRQQPVTLASGRQSNFYVDCKQTALHAVGAACIGRLIFAHVEALRARGLPIVGVGGLTLGADPLAVACALTSASASAPVHAFVVRKQAKGHGTQAFLEGGHNVPPRSHVLIVDDVVTTGASTVLAVERATACGLVPAALLCLVDREEGGAEALMSLGLPFAALVRRRELEEAPSAAPGGQHGG